MLIPSSPNYSQTQLLNEPLMSGKHDAYTRRLQKYAVIAGVLSTIISLATLIMTALR